MRFEAARPGVAPVQVDDVAGPADEGFMKPEPGAASNRIGDCTKALAAKLVEVKGGVPGVASLRIDDVSKAGVMGSADDG